MESTLLTFTNDLKTLASFQEHLPPENFYIAGLCRQASGADIDQIVLLMIAVEEAVVLTQLTEDQKNLIFFAISEGRLNEANRMFKDLTEAPRPTVPIKAKKKANAYALAAEQAHAFTQSVEIAGKIFARNPYTGEITTPKDAESLENNLRELAEKLDKEEESKETEELRRSEELARKLQAEFDSGIEKPAEEATCQICLSAIVETDLLPLDACGHLFHQDCIREHMEMSITSSQFPLLCPLRSCQAEISTLDIKERLSPEMVEKFEEFSFKHFVGLNKSSLFCCPTPDCKYVFQYACEEEFQCPVCTKHYCLRCQVEFHDGMSCEQYRKVNAHLQEDDMFLQMAQGSRFKQCPNCKFWVEKTEGCDHMVCRCQFEFCYACGGVYMACECMNMRGRRAMRPPMRRMRQMRPMPERQQVPGRPRAVRAAKRGGVNRRVWR